jgi:hypothetical protein
MSLWFSHNSRSTLCRLRGMKLLILLVLVASSTAIATTEPIKKPTDYQLGTATGVSVQRTLASSLKKRRTSVSTIGETYIA